VNAAVSSANLDSLVRRWGRIALIAVLAIATLDWIGWGAGIPELTRIAPSWPVMTPWTALLLAILAAAQLCQSNDQSKAAMLLGRGLAATVGLLALAILSQYLTDSFIGIDQVWFGDSVRTLHSSWPGRPSPQTLSSVSLLSAAALLTSVHRRWATTLWPILLSLAAALPLVAFAAYLFQAVSLVVVTPTTGVAISTSIALLLVAMGSLLIRPDRNPVAWFLRRPDARTLLRMVGVLAGLPLLIGVLRLVFLALGMDDQPAVALAIATGTFVIGLGVFYLSQHEQGLLIEQEVLSRQRADAEARYRILADNAVDIIVRLRGNDIVWISPSVQTAFGDSPQNWIGSDLSNRIHPDDRDMVLAKLEHVNPETGVHARFRVRNGAYHWVDGHGKSYVDPDGASDDVIMALRIADDQVEAEHHLERLARFDTLTGLVNRAEAISRFESALKCPRSPGPHLGVLFCDIDRFKDINDTWGHAAGDAVLAVLATRIVDGVRHGDTVGRLGGDEVLVLLPDIHNLDEVVAIAENIRKAAAEPIMLAGKTITTTISIGATIANRDEPVDPLLARADEAMYAAKRTGRNSVARI